MNKENQGGKHPSIQKNSVVGYETNHRYYHKKSDSNLFTVLKTGRMEDLLTPFVVTLETTEEIRIPLERRATCRNVSV